MENNESTVNPAQDQNTDLKSEDNNSEIENLEEKGGCNKKFEIFIAEPSNVNCKEDLDEVIKIHGIWLESVINPRKKIKAGRANLTGADLSGYDLSGVNLSGATFKNTNLQNVNFTNAVLSGADFSGADLNGVNFSGAKLKKATFNKANLENAVFEGADLRGADISI